MPTSSTGGSDGGAREQRGGDSLMAKFYCVCGNLIRVSGDIPNPIEWKIISDDDFDQFEGLVDAERVYLACESMFKCDVCGRLWVYWNGVAAAPVCYAPEESARAPTENRDDTTT